MSRVEKYREYRNEIAQLPDEPKQTKKRESSQRVDRLLNQDNHQHKLGFDDVYDGLDIYNVEPHTNSSHPNYGRRNLIIFYSIMSVIIVGLIVGLILVGKSVFGG